MMPSLYSYPHYIVLKKFLLHILQPPLEPATDRFWPKAVTMYFVNLWAILRLAFIRRDAWEGKNGSQTQNASPAECGL